MKMKRITRPIMVMSLLILFSISSFFTTPVCAAKKRINILGSFGLASFFFDDPIVNLGVEFQLIKGFYGRVSVSSTLGSGTAPGFYDPYYYGIGGFPGSGFGIAADSMMELNTTAVYKQHIFKKINLFWQAGFFFLHYNEYSYESEMNFYVQGTTNSFGASGGTGVEFILSGSLDIAVGGTYQGLFNKELLDPDNGKIRSGWLKFYVGLNFRIK
jgi:hypothetical protein